MIWPETWVWLIIAVLGLLIIFGRTLLFIALGTAVFLLLGLISQNESNKRHHKAYVIERFKAGDSLECGVLFSNQTLVDPSKGWKLYGENRFIKDDQIRQNDWCRVAGKPSPEPLALFNWLFYALLWVVFGILRFVFRNKRNAFYAEWDKLDEQNKNTASEKTELEPKTDKQGEEP